jgi:hypothetical protein
MERQDIYIKTEKASEEIQNRKYRLPQSIRSLLIMIDGTTTIGGYMDQAVALGDVSKMLRELEQQGFIKRRAAIPKTPQPATAAEKSVAGTGPVKGSTKTGGGMIDLGTLFTPASEKKNKEEKK